MKNYILFLIATFLLAGNSCQKKQQITEKYQNEAKQKIAEVSKLWTEAWENEDLDSLMTFLDEGFLNMFSFGSEDWNKEQCREGFKESFDTNSIENLEYKTVETVVDQNYAFEILLFKQKIISNDKKDTTSYDSRIMMVYKKQEEGSWKMFRLFGQQ